MWLDLGIMVKVAGTAKDWWLTTVMTRERERREVMCVATDYERPLWVRSIQVYSKTSEREPLFGFIVCTITLS